MLRLHIFLCQFLRGTKYWDLKKKICLKNAKISIWPKADLKEAFFWPFLHQYRSIKVNWDIFVSPSVFKKRLSQSEIKSGILMDQWTTVCIGKESSIEVSRYLWRRWICDWARRFAFCDGLLVSCWRFVGKNGMEYSDITGSSSYSRGCQVISESFTSHENAKCSSSH